MSTADKRLARARVADGCTSISGHHHVPKDIHQRICVPGESTGQLDEERCCVSIQCRRA